MAPKIEIHRHLKPRPWTYQDLLARDRQVQARVLGGGQGAVLVSEVAPVITLGKRTPLSDLTLSRSEYEARGVEILPTDRGGLATYHGPGQWVIFPCDSLERWVGDPRGVRKFVHSLLDAVLPVIRNFKSDAEIQESSDGQVGIFSKRGKLASLGIRIDQGVVLHGLAVNGFRTETSFVGLRPCGQDVGPDFCLSPDASDADFLHFGQALGEALARLSKA